MPSSKGSSDPGIEHVCPAFPAQQLDSLLLSHREAQLNTDQENIHILLCVCVCTCVLADGSLCIDTNYMCFP